MPINPHLQRASWLTTLVLLALPSATFGQAPSPNPRDVESLDAILGALYDVISGPAGEARDWNRFRSLFLPEAQFVPTGMRADGTVGHRVLDVEGFIASSGAGMEAQGFFEREIARTIERFGPVLHAFSTYESRRAVTDAQPFARGINSIQLLETGERWWIVNVFWHNETAQTPIPAAYLPGGSW